MTKEEIVRLALEAGFDKYEACCLSGESDDDRLVAVQEYPIGGVVLKFASLIAKAEREACAKICDARYQFIGDSADHAIEECAAAIRKGS